MNKEKTPMAVGVPCNLYIFESYTEVVEEGLNLSLEQHVAIRGFILDILALQLDVTGPQNREDLVHLSFIEQMPTLRFNSPLSILQTSCGFWIFGDASFWNSTAESLRTTYRGYESAELICLMDDILEEEILSFCASNIGFWEFHCLMSTTLK